MLLPASALARGDVLADGRVVRRHVTHGIYGATFVSVELESALRVTEAMWPADERVELLRRGPERTGRRSEAVGRGLSRRYFHGAGCCEVAGPVVSWPSRVGGDR